MTANPEHESRSVARCWCCGTPHSDEDLVHLGEHPEVGVCLGCARWLQRRAVERYDEQHPSMAARLRAGIRTARTAVIRKGWHQRGVLGAVLRRIDRHLP